MASSDDDAFAAKWGVPSEVVSAGTPAAAPVPPDEDAAFAKKWGVDPAVAKASPDAPMSPIARINQAAEKLGLPSDMPISEKAAAIFKETHAQRMAVQGEASVAGDPGSSASMAASGNFISGIPVAGAPLLAGSQRVGAGLRSLINGTPYADELSFVQGAQKEADEEHPTLAAGGKVAGAVYGFGMGGATATGAKLLGAGPGAMLPRIGTSAATNAVIGGADAITRGEDPRIGAVSGAIGGAAAPPVAELAGMGATKLADLVRGAIPTKIPGISRSAANLANTAIQADDPNAIMAALGRHGDQAMLADAGPSLTGLTSGLATKPSDAKSVIYNALLTRAQGANSRITNDITSAMGPAEDPVEVKLAIEAHRKAVDAVNYGQALGNAPAVDPTRAVALIDSRMPVAAGMEQKALQNLRGMLVEPGNPAQGIAPSFRSDAELLHNVKGEIDNVINYDAPGLGVPAGAVNRQQAALKSVRGAINDALESQVPGYADANSASAAMFRREAAVGAGTQALDSGKTAVPPARFASNFGAMAPGEQIALNKGTRGEIDRLVGTKSNDPAALRVALQGEGGWNTAKLSTAFGEEPTNRLVNAVDREAQFSNTMNAVVSNAQTAHRLAAAKLVADTEPRSTDLSPVNMLGLALQGGKKLVVNPIIRMIMENPTAPRNLELARILTAQGPERDALLNSLRGLSSRQNAVSGAGSAVSRGGSMLANRLLLTIGGSNLLQDQARAAN